MKSQKYLTLILIIFREINITEQNKDIRHDVCRVTRSGTEYQGKISETKSNRICEYWDSSSLAGDQVVLDLDFPDGNRRLARNFCRNPSNSPDGPWCFVRSEGGNKETCIVPICCNDENCRYTGPGMEYVGSIHKSVYDNECLYWASTEKRKGIENMLPEGSFMLAGKSCRNPTGLLSGPWCYVLSGELEHENETWTQEPCDIPTCFNLQFITLVTNEAANGIENYYTHFSSLHIETENILFSIRLWNPEDWRHGEIKIALTLLATPVTGTQLRSWDIGYEIIIRNIKTGATPNTDEDENWENNAGLVSGIQWSNLKLSWNNGFLSLSGEDKEKPYFIHEIKSQGNGIISRHSLAIRYISVIGTNMFWNFTQSDEHCQEQITTSMKVTRYWLLLIESMNKFLGFHLRSTGTSVIYLKLSPVTPYPRVQLRITEDGKVGVYLDKNENLTTILASATLPSPLSFWKWAEFSVSISGHRLHVFITTNKGLETIFDVNNAVFQATKWFSIASSSTTYWTLFCKPTQMEYEAMPPECSVSDTDLEYDGHQWTTESGRPCLPWNAGKVNDLEDGQFPDGSITGALNYCRNPTSDEAGAYCIGIRVQNGVSTDKEACRVRKCKFKDCRIAGTATDFMGEISSTITGRECQAWTSNSPHKIPTEFLFDYRFPERSAKKASNYCRNPLFSIGGPYCYTTDPEVQVDLCNIPDCYMPIACTTVVTMATKRKVYMMPQWRAHGLPLSIKMWNPNISTALIFNVFPMKEKYSYQLILGDDNNEYIKLYYVDESGDEKLLKQKTEAHFLSSGRWVSILIRIHDTEINISYEDSPNPFFIWRKGVNEKLPAINAMFFSYEAKSDEFDQGSIGLKFPCQVCHTEICLGELSPYSVFYPMNIWKQENSSIILDGNITFYAIGKGSFQVNLFVVPAKIPIGILFIDDGVKNDRMEIQYTMKQYMGRIAIKHKDSPAIVENYWSEITLTVDGRNGSLILNGTTFMNWTYPRLPLMYFFSVKCNEQMTWTVNCKPPKLDGKPIDGQWSPWSAWECSVTCGGGRGVRRRICNSPEPSMFGKTCPGLSIEKGTCHENVCGDVTIDTINLIRKYLAGQANNIEALANDPVKLQCNANILRILKNESPKSLVYWNRNGEKILNSEAKLESLDSDSFKVDIAKANITHSGVYACVVVKQDEEHEIIDVLALIVKTKDYTLTKRLGNKLRLKANTVVLSSVYSNLRLTWFCNKRIYKDYDVTDLRLLDEELIPRLTKDDDGEWTCVVYQDQLALNWTTNWYKIQIKSKANWATYILEDLFKGAIGSHEIVVYLMVCIIFVLVIGVTIASTLFIIKLQNYFKNLNKDSKETKTASITSSILR